jgi:hypothetical protein
MHGFFANVTATLLAMHTVLGCCWHHVHACACERDNGLLALRVTNIGSLDRCEAHRADTHDDGCSSHHGHHGRHECQGNTCVFLGPTKSGPNFPTLRFVPPPVACVSCVAPVAYDGQSRPLLAIDALSPPLRLHLLHRVLLL